MSEHTVDGAAPIVNPSETQTAEQWRPVVGWEQYYRVSDFGRVLSLDRRVRHWRGGDRRVFGKMLGQFLRRGYLSIAMRRDGGKQENFVVHRLVVSAFIGPIPFGMQVNHIDGHKENNHVTNLEIVTPRGNVLHAMAMGLTVAAHGEDSGHAKVTEIEVRKIREAADRGVPFCQIGAVFNIAIPTVSNIVNRETWRHVS